MVHVSYRFWIINALEYLTEIVGITFCLTKKRLNAWVLRLKYRDAKTSHEYIYKLSQLRKSMTMFDWI